MDYGRLVLQRWDQGADRIPDLKVYGPPPIARMTEQLFGADGVYGPDIRARIEHQQQPRRVRGARRQAAAPAAGAAGHRDPRRRSVVEGNGWKVTRRPRPARAALSRVSGASGSTPSEGSICYTGDSGAERRHRRAGEGLRHPDPHEPLLQRHRADAGLPRRVRQSPRQRRHRQARRREDAGADAPARRRSISRASASRSSTRSRRCSTAR